MQLLYSFSLFECQPLQYFLLDEEAPMILTVPGDINITTDAGEPFGTATWDIPTVSANFSNYTLSSTHEPGDMFDIGATTVIYTLTDAAGNTDTVSFTVFVRGMYQY